jgi:hypothetical protein
MTTSAQPSAEIRPVVLSIPQDWRGRVAWGFAFGVRVAACDTRLTVKPASRLSREPRCFLTGSASRYRSQAHTRRSPQTGGASVTAQIQATSACSAGSGVGAGAGRACRAASEPLRLTPTSSRQATATAHPRQHNTFTSFIASRRPCRVHVTRLMIRAC